MLNFCVTGVEAGGKFRVGKHDFQVKLGSDVKEISAVFSFLSKNNMNSWIEGVSLFDAELLSLLEDIEKQTSIKYRTEDMDALSRSHKDFTSMSVITFLERILMMHRSFGWKISSTYGEQSNITTTVLFGEKGLSRRCVVLDQEWTKIFDVIIGHFHITIAAEMQCSCVTGYDSTPKIEEDYLDKAFIPYWTFHHKVGQALVLPSGTGGFFTSTVRRPLCIDHYVLI